MEDGYHEVDYPERWRYEGEFKDGRPHGQGIMKYTNGDVYEGEFMGGYKHGKGTMKYANGDVYDGDWKDGHRSSWGLMKYANGDVYDGGWKNGLRGSDYLSSWGLMKYANGDVYDGEWKSDSKWGHGIMKYANGDVYDGEWKRDEKDGYGSTSYANGDKYDGKYSNGDELVLCENCSTFGRFYEDVERCTICENLICPECARKKSKPIECSDCAEQLANHMSKKYGDDLDAEDETIGHRQGGYDPYKND